MDVNKEIVNTSLTTDISDEALNSCFFKQKSYFLNSKKNASISDRIKELRKIKEWLWQNRQKIREALYQDSKKPEVEADLTEIKPILRELDNTIRHLKKWAAPKKVSSGLALLGTSSKVIYEPMGVVLIIAPWNFPFNLSIGPLVSALAAGNCVFIKPSEFAPNTARLVSTMIGELFPPEKVVVVEGDVELAEKLLKLPFNHIFFTGSPEVGKKVMKAAAEHLASVTLELGGQNPLILDETADLKDAAQKIIYNKMINAGQSCLGVNYALIEQSIYADFVDVLKKEFENMYPCGINQLHNSPDFSRIINNKHFDRLNKIIEDAKESGVSCIWEGKGNRQDNYIPFTVLACPDLNNKLLEQELFGPVLPLIPYSNLDEVLRYLNLRPAPLAIYIFSQDESRIEKIMKATTAGTTAINETTLQFIHPHLPFGGVNNSGIGKAHGHYGFLAFSNQRAVLRQRVGHS
ncbi:MAG TPA: aldehyde dehydrogenase family protein, partial [Cytophagaceae bacterium]